MIYMEDEDFKIYKLLEWLAKEKNLATNKARGFIEKETEKALQLRLKNDELIWLPKSQIIEDKPDKGQLKLI